MDPRLTVHKQICDDKFKNYYGFMYWYLKKNSSVFISIYNFTWTFLGRFQIYGPMHKEVGRVFRYVTLTVKRKQTSNKSL